MNKSAWIQKTEDAGLDIKRLARLAARPPRGCVRRAEAIKKFVEDLEKRRVS